MRLIVSLIALLAFTLNTAAQSKSKQDYYMVRIYHCVNPAQVSMVEEFAGKQLIPFLHKNGVKQVGVFQPVDNDTLKDKKVFVWIPFASLDQMAKTEAQFEKFDPWSTDPMIHLDSANGQAPYVRIETSISTAFRFMTSYDPKTSFKRSADNIYEYRNYESSTENLHLGKVNMFNEGGEITLFKKLDFNALFYARVIAGPRMPNLIYMTRFENMDARNAHWKSFVDAPEWKTMSALPKYQGNVSRNETILLKASPLSDL
jgi:hypothetical protein